MILDGQAIVHLLQCGEKCGRFDVFAGSGVRGMDCARFYFISIIAELEMRGRVRCVSTSSAVYTVEAWTWSLIGLLSGAA
jgi:hypothetical protein